MYPHGDLRALPDFFHRKKTRKSKSGQGVNMIQMGHNDEMHGYVFIFISRRSYFSS